MGAYYAYFSRNLDEAGKQPLKQRLAVLFFALALGTVWFSQPDYAYYIDTSLTHVNTIEDARKELESTNETLEKFVKDAQSRDNAMQMLIVVLIWVLPFLLGANAGKNNGVVTHDEKPISIFDNDNR